MTIASVADKLAVILPRLASTHDGEVVATARAIERTLKGAGADWHDLAETFTRGAAAIVVGEKSAESQTSRHKSQSRSAPTWDSLSLADRIAWLEMCAGYACLTPWEQGFVASILRTHRCNAYHVFTPKQKALCERIIYDAWNMGISP